MNSRTGNFNNNNDNDNNRNTLLSYKTHLDDSFLSVPLEIIYIILPTNGQNLQNTWNHNRENKIFLFLLTLAPCFTFLEDSIKQYVVMHQKNIHFHQKLEEAVAGGILWHRYFEIPEKSEETTHSGAFCINVTNF